MVTDEQAMNAVLSKYGDSKVQYVAPFKAGKLVCIVPKNAKDDSIFLDPFFTVDSGLNVKEFSPMMDIDEFKKAVSKRIEY